MKYGDIKAEYKFAEEKAVLVELASTESRQFKVQLVEVTPDGWTTIETLHEELYLDDTLYHLATEEAKKRDAVMLYGTRVKTGQALSFLWKWQDCSDHCEQCREYTDEIQSLAALLK